MRKLCCIALLAAAALFPGTAGAARGVPPAVWAGACGVPSVSPVWVDYGWPTFASLFGKPGVVVGASSGNFGAQMRAAGASTVYFDLYLKSRVGQPATPADPSTIQAKADKLYAYAVQQMGCSTPVIVENELFGAGLVTPWSDTNAQYRQNVLAFLQALRAHGAYPVLLINSDPYTGGDAAAWWQQVAAVADIVREAYVPATLLAKEGPIVANRTLRIAYRSDSQQLTSIGIPPQRLGIMVSFSTTNGFGGRNGLQPAQAWYEVAKWQALSAREVATELGLGSIWSWGWAEWTPAETDPAKVPAACVWLWTRAPGLCNGPGAAGKGFDASRTEGQIVLGDGVQCTFGGRGLSNDAIQRLQLMTGDRDTAFTALFQRVVENAIAPVSPKKVVAAERSVIATSFHGSRAAYVAALAQAHANVNIARGILGDELRRAKIEQTLPAKTPSAKDVQTFYQSYPDLLVRLVKAKRGTPWLGGHKRGLLLAAVAPDQLFSGGRRTVWTPTGPMQFTPLANAVPLGSVPLSVARPAIVAALEQFSRGDAYEQWTEARQAGALSTAICQRDDLPQPGAIDLSQYLPFLRLS